MGAGPVKADAPIREVSIRTLANFIVVKKKQKQKQKEKAGPNR
jgi:hypothetical protein